ncbi:MAG: pilus assembly protein PilM [Planctomycetes bacterium]|nr:pilus assembly protein PilM [Planctomycetota bacterium]
MAKLATGIDVGTTAVRIVQGYDKKGVFTLSGFVSSPRQGEPATEALIAALDGARVKPAAARIGVTGRDAMFRYLQIPDTGDAQLKKFVDFEVSELNEQSGGDIVGGFNLLHPPSLSDELTVGIALTKASLLEELASELKASTKLRAKGFSPNAVALFDAWLRTDPEGGSTVLIASIGEENTDVAIANGTDLYFARNLSGGARFFVEALREKLRVTREEAIALLRDQADLDPAKKGSYASPKAEKVTQALLGPAGQLNSLLQSAQMFARTQAKISELKVDRILLCGGGARTGGLCPYLATTTGLPVELFDPFDDIDLSELPDELFEALEGQRLEAVVALGHALAEADPKLYQLEIVPPSLARRRNLLQRTSFLVAAGVLALAYLILAYDRASETRGILERYQKTHGARVSALLAADQQATRAAESFSELWGRSARIEPWLQASPALLAALETVQSVLPEDFTIERVQLARASASAGSGIDGRPIVQIAIHYMQRGGDWARDRRSFYENGLLAPGRFTPQQCRVLEGAKVPQAMKRASLVLEIDPFAPTREVEPEAEVAEAETGGEKPR